MSAGLERSVPTTPPLATHRMPPLLRQLPSGRHGLPREFVTRSQRARLLEAVLAVVGGEGYATVSVARVARAAGVSSTTFYQHFANKEGCLLAGCDASLGRLLGRLREGIAAEADWATGVGEGLRWLLARLAGAPQLARVWFVELRAVDIAGALRHVEALESLALALRPPSGNPPNITDVCERVIAGGVWNTIHTTIVSDSPAALPRLLPALHYHVLVYHLGPEEACRISRRSD
jgi:AcrR family transcriptional regulator